MSSPSGHDGPAQPEAGRGLHWPAGLSPGCADVWACSEVAVPAAPAAVFARLVTVSRWERDFSSLRDVRPPLPGCGYLEPDSEFGFELDGLRLCARVSEFVPGRRLAWSGQGIDITVYQAWVISSRPGGSQVLAGFAARGAAAVALRETDPGAGQRALDRWVAGLKYAAESAALKAPEGALKRRRRPRRGRRGGRLAS
jgi:hypothetical protein